MTAFDQAFALVVANEGGYTVDPADPGNWTGGVVGHGVCLGTKWGISAAAYPTLDIRNLTENEARTIYRQRYWVPICGDRMPAPLSVLMFDAAVNLGVSCCVKLLQQSVGTPQDGLLGPITLAAVGDTKIGDIEVDFQANRLIYMVKLPEWKTFGPGWARRLMLLAFSASTTASG